MNVSKRLRATLKAIEGKPLRRSADLWRLNKGKLAEIRDLANYKYHVDCDPIMTDWAFDLLDKHLGPALGSSLPESYSAGIRELARFI